MCVHDGDFSYTVPPLDGDKRLFYESAVKTFKLKKNAEAQTKLHDFSNPIRSLHTVRHGSNKLGYDMCVDCTMMSPIDLYATTLVTIK